MALGNPAENLEDVNPLDDPEKEDQQKNADSKDTEGLSTAEQKAIEKGHTTIDAVVTERNRLAQNADAELEAHIRPDQDGHQLVDLDEYKSLKDQIEGTKSAEEMKDLLKRLKELPKEKEKKKAKEEDKSKELSPDHKEIKTRVKKFNAICDLNKALIGTGELPGFKSWFMEEMRKEPTIKKADEIIEKLEGTKVKDANGLHPRREVFQELTQMFKETGLSSPLDNKYIKREGLSERKAFIHEAKRAKQSIESSNDKFWSPKAKKEAMGEILKADKPADIKKMTQDIKNMSKIESEGFTYMKNTMKVEGHTVRMMSDASIALYLEGISGEGDLKKRMQYLTGFGTSTNGIVDAVKNEGSLFKKELTASAAKIAGNNDGLAGIYKDDKEGFADALRLFQALDFMGKVDALKDHKKLVEGAKTKEEKETIKTKIEAKAAINKSASKKEISRETQGEWVKWFDSKDALKDPETGKETGLAALKKHFDILTDEKPSAKHKNLSAFKIKRNRFVKEVKEFSKDNPDVTPADLQKWQDKYDKADWTDRKKVYKAFEKERDEVNKERKKKEAIESEVGEKDKKKEKAETAPEVKKMIEAGQNLMNENQNEEAYALLAEHWLQHRLQLTDSEKDELEFWMGTAKSRMDKFGRGEEMEDEMEKEVEQEVERLADHDTEISEDIDEEGLYHMNLEGAELSELRHNKKKDSQERARKESIEKAKGDDLKKDLTEDFYEQTDDEHILNREGTGEEIKEMKMDDTKITKEDRASLRETTRKHESDLTQKRGFTHVIFKDKGGRALNTEQATNVHEQNLEKIEDNLAEKALDKVASKQGQEKASNVFDLNARIAAKRKAKEKVEEEMENKKRLREAA
ncbi:hypothetical protein HN709_03655 [Candidatus Peregrinibacteria bacterium]|nr:hypothetical protein [Candidatus Peregrinibacteria bacterium]